MIDEQIRDGDLVVCERRAQPRNGETVVALVDGGEATLTRLERDGSRVRLEPANARLKPIVLAEERVEIQGVVVGVIRRY